MEQTKVTKENRIDFFKIVYTVQSLPKDELFDLSLYKDKIVVAVDSCGFYYEQLFFNVKKVEYIETVKQYKFDISMFDKLFTDPTNISIKCDVLLLDHCPVIFKYKSVSELKHILSTMVDKMQPMHCLVRMNCATLNDNRFTDRFKSLSSILPDNYIVENFNYDVRNQLSFKLLKKHDFSFN